MQEKILLEKGTGKTRFGTLAISIIGIILFLIAAEVDASASHEVAAVLYIIGGFMLVFGVVLFFSIIGCKIGVSDKRIYGTALWGKRVDLPLDSISAVAIGWLSSISVATSSGRISFIAISERDAVYRHLSNLLIERQSKTVTTTTTIKQEIPQSNADELKKYKELLDSGTITQEEFDAKKKQLLGL